MRIDDMTSRIRSRLLAAGLALLCVLGAPARAADPLPSWNDGPSKARIIGFVEAVTDRTGKDFVPEPERVAVFDNDGTLWTEQPAYVQLMFAIDRARAMAAANPQLKSRAPFAAAVDGDMKRLAAGGERGLMQLVMVTHAGMTSDEFTRIVKEWLAGARHPTLKRRYTDLVYQPMLEVLAYFRANGFRTYIVSGGGVEFVRAFSEERYGVPPQQVIGSSIRARYEVRDGRPVIVRLPEIDFVDDKAGKPVGIHRFIGQRPIAAFGNSVGDFEMLEWTTAGSGARLGVIVHHDDAEREFAYDRDSSVGRLARALDEAPRRGWTVTSMKRDWKAIYPEVGR
jgi:hypothetical protein